MLPLLLLLSAGSGVAALIYEVVWFQLLELVIGSTAVSLGVVLATFMGGMCLGSLILPRFVSAKRRPLRVYAAIEIGIGVLGILVLLVMPFVGGVYTAWTGYGLRGFLLRGVVAAACLVPPTLLMGSTLPALARRVEAAGGVSWLGLLYGSNIAGAVFGCLLSGFYLLRVYDVATATYVAAAINAAVAGIALMVVGVPISEGRPGGRPRTRRSALLRTWSTWLLLCRGFALLRVKRSGRGSSDCCSALRFTRFPSSWRSFSPASGSAAASAHCSAASSLALGWRWGGASCSLPAQSLGPRTAWPHRSLTGPINPSISPDIWFNFQLDLDRAFWALLPPTLLWGASFPLALAAAAPKRDNARLFAGVYAANTLGAIAGALGASLLLVAWLGSQRTEQVLIAISLAAALLLLLPRQGPLFSSARCPAPF